jgi:hypothetical protein
MGDNFLPCARPTVSAASGVAGLAAGGESGLVHPRCGGPEGSTTNEFLVPNRFDHRFTEQARRCVQPVPHPTVFDSPVSDGRQLL